MRRARVAEHAADQAVERREEPKPLSITRSFSWSAARKHFALAASKRLSATLTSTPPSSDADPLLRGAHLQKHKARRRTCRRGAASDASQRGAGQRRRTTAGSRRWASEHDERAAAREEDGQRVDVRLLLLVALVLLDARLVEPDQRILEPLAAARLVTPRGAG